MSLLWEKSESWRWLVRKTRDSKPFFFFFAAACGVVPGVIGYCVMQFTNSRQEQLEAHLRKTASPESTEIEKSNDIALKAKKDESDADNPLNDDETIYMMMGQVNKERLAEFLGELQRKEDINDRYAAALRGEILTRKPYVRIQPLPKEDNEETNKETPKEK